VEQSAEAISARVSATLPHRHVSYPARIEFRLCLYLFTPGEGPLESVRVGTTIEKPHASQKRENVVSWEARRCDVCRHSQAVHHSRNNTTVHNEMEREVEGKRRPSSASGSPLVPFSNSHSQRALPSSSNSPTPLYTLHRPSPPVTAISPHFAVDFRLGFSAIFEIPAPNSPREPPW